MKCIVTMRYPLEVREVEVDYINVTPHEVLGYQNGTKVLRVLRPLIDRWELVENGEVIRLGNSNLEAPVLG